MMIMLLAVTLFFVLAGMLVLVTQVSNLKASSTIIQSDNAKLLASKIADSAEFSCGASFGTVEMSSCIDADKVINLKNFIKEYGGGNFWGVQGLQIRKIYPDNSGIECTSSNFPNCDVITLIPINGTGVSNFVSLCGQYNVNGQIYSRCDLAKIIISYQGS